MVAAENLPHLKEIPIVERSVEPCDPTGENLVLDDALAAKAGTDFEQVERLEIELVGDLGIRRRGKPRAPGGRGIDGAIGVQTRLHPRFVFEHHARSAERRCGKAWSSMLRPEGAPSIKHINT